MGERKGQNHYYPPDYDPKVGGLNKFLGTHALRERARKLHMGILIIRFEMPYNIWCDGCNNHIGMGVRYNAEKKKVGMYYSTPVYQFRMKCHLCDNHFEIKTDPGNLDYVIVSGARRQENRWDPTDNGQIVPETKETQKKLFDDAMFKLEHKKGDADVAKLDKPRLGRLVGRNETVWKDDYEANCSLRRNFRKRRKELEEAAANDGLLLTRSSLDINLLPESEEDRNLATLLSLRPSSSIEEKQRHTRNTILNSPALTSSCGLITSFGGLKKEEQFKSSPLTRNALGITIKKSKMVTDNSEKSETVSQCETIVPKRVTDKVELENNNKGVGVLKKNVYNGEVENNIRSNVIIRKDETLHEENNIKMDDNLHDMPECDEEAVTNLKHDNVVVNKNETKAVNNVKIDGKSENENKTNSEAVSKFETNGEITEAPTVKVIGTKLLCDYSSSGESSD